MVKGISRQVIVVHSPDKKLFDQAIFILKEDALTGEGITDDALMKEAKRLIGPVNKKRNYIYGPVWACAGALLTGLVWLISALI